MPPSMAPPTMAGPIHPPPPPGRGPPPGGGPPGGPGGGCAIAGLIIKSVVARRASSPTAAMVSFLVFFICYLSWCFPFAQHVFRLWRLLHAEMNVHSEKASIAPLHSEAAARIA